MSKIMTLDVLSNIKGAKESTVVSSLFNSIKNAEVNPVTNANLSGIVDLETLREDVPVSASETEKSIIRQNFPNSKENYLVVAKVIEE